VKAVSSDNFGLLIAYLLPGFVALWAVSYFSETVQSWLGTSPVAAPTVGGFLYVTLGSTAIGLIISAVRWAILDTLHHRTGINEPNWRFAQLPERLPAFEALVEYHYRYYQFYSNMLVAILFSYGTRLTALHRWPGHDGWGEVALFLVVIVLFLGSRDTLRKYYSRASALLHAAEADPVGSETTSPKGRLSPEFSRRRLDHSP
jgi:hypothetical protein